MNTLHNPFKPSSRHGIVSLFALGGNILHLLQTEFFVHLPNCHLPLVSTFQSRDRAVIGREKVGMGRIPSGMGGDDGSGSDCGSESLPGHAMDVESVVCCSILPTLHHSPPSSRARSGNIIVGTYISRPAGCVCASRQTLLQPSRTSPPHAAMPQPDQMRPITTAAGPRSADSSCRSTAVVVRYLGTYTYFKIRYVGRCRGAEQNNIPPVASFAPTFLVTYIA